MYHTPVLLKQVIEYLAPKSGGLYFDGTLGGGGYSRAIIEAGAKVVAADIDADAIKEASANLKEFGDKAKIVHASYAEIKNIAAREGVKFDGAVLDLGVSSFQFDEASRGFSFQKDGPLDMRMDVGLEMTAEDVLKNYSEKELVTIFEKYGEERFAKRIARKIIENKGKIKTTGDLEKICFTSYPPPLRHGHTHPATKVFQALRIFVNGELENLEKFLNEANAALKDGGRLVIVSYHSLEDRIVKNKFKEFNVLTKKPVTATDDEVAENPRARSAKLRACVIPAEAGISRMK